MKNVYILIINLLNIIKCINDWKLVKKYEKETNLKNFTLNIWNKKLILFGGCKVNENCSNNIYLYDFDKEILQKIGTKGNVPSPRSGHSAIVYGNDLIIYGGSNRFGVLGDLYILNLILFKWRKVDIEGFKPEARSFHTSNLDKNMRMIIFGGYKNNKLTNEIIFYDLRKNKWIKPIVTGKIPLPRENHSSTLIDNILWIFGGYTNGSALNDLNIFNLDNLKWKHTQIDGIKPSIRQSSIIESIENNIFISGGCNYQIGKCYNDLWKFNISKMNYKKIMTKSNYNINIGKSIIKGSMIYYVGGCFMNNSCDSKILKLNTTISCPNECSNNGLCDTKGECHCNKLNFGNDCSYKYYCLKNCGKNAYCTSSGNCKCYSGYKGENCEIEVNCKNNCTDHLHGVCLLNGICDCHKDWDGDDCTEKLKIKKKSKLNKLNLKNNNFLKIEMFGYTQFKQKQKEEYKNFFEKYQKLTSCKNNCNYRGFCSENKCYCKNGYYGESCSLTKDIKNKDFLYYLLLYIGIGLLIGIFSGSILSYMINKNKNPVL